MPDELAAATRELALAALHEVTPASTVGPAAGHMVEDDGAVSLRFENRLPGYPGWYWTVTVAQVDDEEPTVLEVELMPGDSALLAPEWVPWAERLAEYRAHQAELAEQAAAAPDAESEDEDDHDDESGEDEPDEDDEADVVDLLHAGDLDGVDIDELDESVGQDADEDESDDDDDEEDLSDDEADLADEEE